MRADLAISAVLCCYLSSSSALNLSKGNAIVANVTIFNAFSNQAVFAKARFGKMRQDVMSERISYGRHRTSPLYSDNEDYVIQFIKLPSGGETSKCVWCKSFRSQL